MARLPKRFQISALRQFDLLPSRRNLDRSLPDEIGEISQNGSISLPCASGVGRQLL